jgi:uncharacterized protein
MERIKYRLYQNVCKTRPAILFFTGWSPSIIAFNPIQFHARRIAKRLNITCMVVFFRGMGSPGHINILTRQDFLDDAVGSYDDLIQHKNVDPNNIYVIGESFGSYIGSVLTSVRKIKGVILRVPTDFPNQGFNDKPQIQIAGMKSIEWKRQFHSSDESFALRAIANYSDGIFIISSGKDTFVPESTISNYLNSCLNNNDVKHYIMKNSGHGLFKLSEHKEFYRQIYSWLEKRL